MTRESITAAINNSVAEVLLCWREGRSVRRRGLENLLLVRWNFARSASRGIVYVETSGWPILNCAFFAKFRVGMLEAGPQPATDCAEGRDRVEMGRHENANERREHSVHLSNCPTCLPQPSFVFLVELLGQIVTQQEGVISVLCFEGIICG